MYLWMFLLCKTLVTCFAFRCLFHTPVTFRFCRFVVHVFPLSVYLVSNGPIFLYLQCKHQLENTPWQQKVPTMLKEKKNIYSTKGANFRVDKVWIGRKIGQHVVLNLLQYFYGTETFIISIAMNKGSHRRIIAGQCPKGQNPYLSWPLQKKVHQEQVLWHSLAHLHCVGDTKKNLY